MEDTVSAGTDGLVAEHATGSDDTDRRLVILHHAHLHRRGVSAECHLLLAFFLLDEESILHVAGRVVRGEIKGREKMPVILNLNRFRHSEANTGKDIDNLVHHHREDMAATHGGKVGRHGQIAC